MYGDRNKIILLDDRFPTGEPTVQPVVLWGLRGKPCYEPLSKEASASPAHDYIRSIEPVPGRTIVLVIGLGSYEWYGLNRNGDGFPEQPYKMGIEPRCGCCSNKKRDAWVLPEECIQHHYKSYEQGNVFRHHVNKDPNKRIGRILKAFWNPYMHRVEVLEDINNTKAPDLVEQIGDGEFPAKSMGCRIKFDVCTECGHMAPTRKHYCDHLKWAMGQLNPSTGIRNGALNPSPRFFDSSWVIRPADRTGYMLKKVAMPYEVQDFDSSTMGELVDDLNHKAAAARKLADMDKVVRGYPATVVSSPEAGLVQHYRNTTLPALVQRTPQLSRSDLSALAPYRLADTLAALSRAGIILTTPEFVQLFIEKAAPGVTVPPQVLENLTALQSEIFELFSQRPSLLNELAGTLETEEPQHQEALLKTIDPMMEKRSTMQSYLMSRMTPAYLEHGDLPTSDLLDVVDPTSGNVYQTTRGAAQDAQDVLDRNKLLRLGGGAGMLAAAYKVLKSLPGRGKLLSLPLGASGAYLTHSAFKKDPMYGTTSGEQVPYLTEFVEKRGGLMDTVNALGLDYAITKTGATMLEKVAARTKETQPLHLFLQKISSFGLYYPNLTLDRVVAERDKTATDGITEATIDFDKVAEIVGTLAWEIP